MHSLADGFIERQPITQNLLQTVRALGEYRGKQELSKQQAPQVLESLQQVAVVESTESSNRIEGVTAPPDRIRRLVSGTTAPQNRSEQEIAGYRDVLNTIHTHHAGIMFTPGIVLQFHRDLYQFVRAGGRYCPGVSRPTINRALADLRDAGKIRVARRGRDALWEKCDQ